MDTVTSNDFFERAKKVIPGGVSSPVRSFKHVGTPPVYFARGEGAYLWDVEGKSYIDFCLAFGPHLLGHSPAAVVSAVQAQAAQATTFGACHPKEVELAETIIRAYPFLNKVRLVNSGTEAVMTALRLARGATNRHKILMFEGCYHGHSDALLAKAGSGVAELTEASSAGVTPSVVADTLIARLDQPETYRDFFRDHGKEIAAIIIEPIPANYGLYIPKREQLEELCRLARENGSLVVFDEVITGFRVGLGGASHFYDLTPDLVTLGKVIGGGLAVAAVVGTNAVMDCLAPAGPVYQAGTLSGNALGAAAGLAALNSLWDLKPQFNRFDSQCESFVAELRTVVGQYHPVQIRNLGSIFWMHFGSETTSFPPEISSESAKAYAEFFRRALREGIYLPPSPYEVSFISFAHTPEVLGAALERFRKCV